ncbi:hypothetical protein [Nonomuraea zeae]|uniref:hypothetical protein n=1 Tax=Nonomuraea zeae TaxID=1642303 RepID=UPI001F0DE5D3|nr:hypothetical protein [Nonomuraea zeae]
MKGGHEGLSAITPTQPAMLTVGVENVLNVMKSRLWFGSFAAEGDPASVPPADHVFKVMPADRTAVVRAHVMLEEA